MRICAQCCLLSAPGDGGAHKVAPPVAGGLALWPSWLPHRVRPHGGERPRVSLSFNIWIEHMSRPAAEPTLDPALVAEQRLRTEVAMGGKDILMRPCVFR